MAASEQWYFHFGWKNFGITFENAVKWKELGLEPEEASCWEEEDFTPDEASAWLKTPYKFSPIEARNWSNAEFSAFQASLNASLGRSAFDYM